MACMKIAHIGDTHLGMVNYTKANPLYGANERLLDYKKCLTFAVDTIIEREVEAVTKTGFRTPRRNGTLRKRFCASFNMVSM